MSDTKRMIITAALPYANGPLHIGHLLEYVQADIFYRFQKLNGVEAYFVCGSDTHGTPMMLKAQDQGITPQALAKRMSAGHVEDFSAFSIAFDAFYHTNRDVNQQFVNQVYQQLQDNGDIQTREIEQAYDAAKAMFLPDRFIKGTCPKCGATDQYGDSCEVCGATYDPTEMKDAVSVISGTTPVRKCSKHYFFKLKHYEDVLSQWLNTDALQNAIAHKLKEWFSEGLKDWDISRDAPYFGFEIPGTTGKYFYVWLDAPLGYLASFKTLCDEKDLNFDTFWKADSTTELHQFLGKDIAYFHALFWPAMLYGAGYRMPTRINAHGFVTINGMKMSKSRGNYISARDYLDKFNSEYLRYYYATKLNGGIEDIDLNLTDFVSRVNADLVGKFVNIASRCAGFIKKKFDCQLADQLVEPALFDEFSQASQSIHQAYQQLDYAKAMREIMALADRANQFIEQYKPWELAKDEHKQTITHQVCTQGINHFYQLMVMLKPIVPKTITSAENFLNQQISHWSMLETPLLTHKINPFKLLLTRLEEAQVLTLTSTNAPPA